jgi:predicted ribosome quality control (RQC) complex YloA/Tae2 family protein
LIALDPRFARMHLEPGPAAAAAEEEGAESPFLAMLRARVEGARIEAVHEVPDERVARIELGRAGDHESPVKMILMVELLGPAANAALLDGDGTVLATARPSRAARLAPGARYEPPPAREAAPRPVLFPEIAPDATTLACSRALADAFAAAEGAAAREDARDRLRREIARRAARLEGARAGFERAIAAAALADERQRDGELLLGNLGRVKRGAREVVVEDWYAGGAPRAIALDPRRPAREEAERYFKAAQKLRRGGALAAERLRALEGERERLDAARAALETPDAEPAAIAAGLGIRAAAPPAKRGAARVSGPRRFRSKDGLEILVGRSDAENERITLREARGADLFLHVEGAPGSHVIVRAERGRPVPLESMLDAAALAVHYSKARGRARALVSATPRKYVRRAPGGRPGAVLLERHETLVVEGAGARLARVLGSAEGREAR